MAGTYDGGKRGMNWNYVSHEMGSIYQFSTAIRYAHIDISSSLLSAIEHIFQKLGVTHVFLA